MTARRMVAPPPVRRTTRPGPLLGLLVVASLSLTSVADMPRGAHPAGAAPARDERAPSVELDQASPDKGQPKVVRITAPQRTRSAPVPPAVIPDTAMIAYETAADAVSCGLHWSVLAAIGRVESDHGRFGGSQLLADGTVAPPIRGIQLDGRAGIATITDTDDGRLDGDVEYDRAIGPMQFIPSTWRRYATDGNGDGSADPDNIHDAALVAARYLCADGGDLRDPAQLATAVFRYNRSQTYVDMVLRLADHYRGARPVVDPMTGDLPRPAIPVVGTPAAPPSPAPTPVVGTPAAPPSAAPDPVETAPVTTTPPQTTSPAPEEEMCPFPGDVPPPPIPSAPPTPSAPPIPPIPPTPPTPPTPPQPLPVVGEVLEELLDPASTTLTAASTAVPATELPVTC